jgi:glyoxylase-like metal-dependent hydrolase (beta-lactamase superfamily II)
MHITTFPLGQLQANCYFLVEDKQCLIIDPADSADFILEEIQRQNLEVVGMMATHGHFDHIMAAGELQLSLSTLYQKEFPLYIHKEDLFLVKRLGETAKFFLGFEPSTLPIATFSFLEAGPLEIGNFSFEVLHTPGHTPGSCSFYFKNDSTLFTGDTLFQGAVGRYDFSYSDKYELKKSVHSLLHLPDETILYPGHGEETSIQMEQPNEDLFFPTIYN